jgi:hypothetical protein
MVYEGINYIGHLQPWAKPASTICYRGKRSFISLSHGQANVEKGFSINSNYVIVNKKADTYTAERIIQDAIVKAGGVNKIMITPSMLLYAKAARSKYKQYLDEQKQIQCKKRTKGEDDQEINIVDKKKRLCKDIEFLQQASEKAAEDAEKTGKREFYVQFNSLRKTLREKKTDLQELDK